MLRVRLMPVSMLVVVGAFAMGAIETTSASALEWHECRNVGLEKGKFESSACEKEGGKKEFEWKPVESAQKVTLLSSSNFSKNFLEGEIGSTRVLIECSKSKGSGEIETAGASKSEVTLEGCSASDITSGHDPETLTACTVPNVTLKFKGQLVTGKGIGAEEELKPKEGKSYGNIELAGASCSLKGSDGLAVTAEGKGIYGALPAPYIGVTEREMPFLGGDDESLLFAGHKASFSGSWVEKATAGEATYVE